MEKITKLLCIACLTFSAASLLSAELYRPNRFVEFGVEATAGVSNNMWGIEDILTETLKIDLQEIADNLPDGGLTFDYLADANVFLNLNIGKNRGQNFRLSFFTGVSGSGYVNLEKEFFEILASGFSIGENKSFTLSGYADLFVNIGASFHTTLFKKYGITITPTYVVPIVYVDDATASVSFSTTADGQMKAEAKAPLTVYSALGLKKFIDNDFSASDITGEISNILSNGGFDLTLEVERPVLKRLDMGVFTRIPIVPGTLHHKMTRTFYAYASEENLLDDLLNGNSRNRHLKYDKGETEYSEDASKSTFRPFRLGVEGAWRPFGAWCTFRPTLNLAVAHPYSSNAIAYPEYALDAQVTLFNILGLNVGTAYENRVFVQRLGFMLNARVLQLDVKALFRSASFVNSFSYAGAGVCLGVRMGF